MNFIIAQIMGVLVSGTAIIAYQQKRKENVLLCNMVVNVFASAQYFLLGALAGGLVCAVHIVKSYVLYLFKKKDRPVPFIVILIVILATFAGGFAGWDNWFSLLPILGFCGYTLALCQDDVQIIRLAGLCLSSCLFVYNIVVGAYIGAICLACEVIAAIIAIFSFKNKPSRSDSP